ncbi:hypothetical protein NA78x_005444 [Anatilimnocola sp. NA78]
MSPLQKEVLSSSSANLQLGLLLTCCRLLANPPGSLLMCFALASQDAGS